MSFFKQSCIFFLFLLLLIVGCNSTSVEKKQIEEANQYVQQYIQTLEQKGFYERLDSNLNSIYPLAQNNSYLMLNYYRAKLSNNVHFDKVDESLRYADSMEILYNNSSKLFRETFEEIYIDALCQKGTFLFTQKKYFQAYDVFAYVVKWTKEHNQPNIYNSVTFSLGLGSYQQGFYDKALLYFQLQLGNLAPLIQQKKIAPREGFYYTQQAISNIGLCYNKLDKLDSANYYFNKALHYIDSVKKNLKDSTIVNHADYAICKAVVFGNIGQTLVKRKAYDLAIESFKKSIQLALYDKATDNIVRDSTQASQTLVQLGEVYKKKNDLANLQFIIQELKYWKPHAPHGLGSNDEVNKGWLQLNAWHSEMIGNKQDELLYLKQYTLLKDSIEATNEKIKEKNLLQVLEMHSKESEVVDLQLKNKLSNIYTWVFVFIATAIAVIAWLFYRSNKKANTTNKLLANLNNEIKQQEKETTFAYEQALDANKEKDKILHIVAHDLRNPLTGIYTLADLMLEDVEDEKLQNILQTISNSSKRATELVNDLVNNQYNKESLTLTTINLNKLLKEVLPLFFHKANEKKINLKLVAKENELFVLADWAKLERVVANLLHNAIKFCNTNGEVKVELKEKNNKAIIGVNDNGIGMSEETVNGLLNTKKYVVRDGTSGEKSYGLGWNICKKIIEAHNGKLLVESKEKKGTTITIEIDIAASA